MTHHGGVAPGWYDDGTGSGAVRWWDGQRWTEHAQPPPQRHAGYPRNGAVTAGVGYPQPAWVGQHVPAPGKRSPSRRLLLVMGLAAVAIIGVFVLVQVFAGGGTKTEWYEEGYAIGKDKAVSLARLGSSPEAACDLALAGTIKFDDNPRSTRVKDLRRGCSQAVEDLAE